MKRLSLLALILLALLLCAACGAAPAESAADEPAAEDTAAETTDSAAESDGAAVAAELLLPAPEGAEDVAYANYDTDGEAPLCELRFTLDGQEAFLRAQPTDLEEVTLTAENLNELRQGALDLYENPKGDISGLSYGWTNIITATVQGRPALCYSCDEAGFVSWVDGGILYNLCSEQGLDQEALTALAERVFVPAE